MANNLTDGLNELAQGFQKRFKVSNKLTLQDMIDLVTPPKNPLLLEPGKFNFSYGYYSGNKTEFDGSSIPATCFIAYDLYHNADKMMELHKKGNFKLVAHLKSVGKNSGVVAWCFDGMQSAAKWDGVSETSTLTVPAGFSLTETTALYFSGNNNRVDLSQSYFELVGND